MNNSKLLKDIIRDKYWDFYGLLKPQYNTNTAQSVIYELTSIANGQSFLYNKEHVENLIIQLAHLDGNARLRECTPIKEMLAGIMANVEIVGRISPDKYAMLTGKGNYS